MSEPRADAVSTIAAARATTSEFLLQSVRNIKGSSEVKVRDEVLERLAGDGQFFPQGWYDPPPGGASMLFADKPYERLAYDTIRDQAYWPRADVRFGDESVGLLYVSSVHRVSGLIGDFGLTVYGGADTEIQKHIRDVHDAISLVAATARVGMRFCDLYAEAMRFFESKNKRIKWMTTQNDTQKTNLGHTIPGSYGGGSLGSSFDEIKQAIAKRRIYINAVEEFAIPETCAFTVEARLADIDNEYLPNTFFHLTVTFSAGAKKICTDFDGIFHATNMDYML